MIDSDGKIKRNRLNRMQVIAITSRIAAKREDFEGKTSTRIAKQLSVELGFLVTSSNIRDMAGPMGLKLRKNHAKAKVDNKNVALVLAKVCREFGMKDDHPLMQEIASL